MSQENPAQFKGAFVFLNKTTSIIVGVLLLLGLYLTSFYNFLFFHSLAEMFSIAIAIGIFMIAWNSRHFSKDSFLLFIGIAALFIGFIDLFHALSYKGMGIFTDYGANLPTQLWIVARYLQALSFLIAIFFIGKKLRPTAVLGGYLVVVTLLFLSIFYWGIFPDAFVEVSGLTDFKKISEYIISIILLLFMVSLYMKRKELDKDVFNWLIVAGVASIVSEIAFTFYVSVFGLSNLVGHIFKIIAFYSLYVAIVQTSLLRPYSTLFGDLKKESEELVDLNKELKNEVKKNTKAKSNY